MKCGRLFFLLLAGAVLIFRPSGGHAQTEGRSGFALTMGTQLLVGRPGQVVPSSLEIIATRTVKVTRYRVETSGLGQRPDGSIHPAEDGSVTRSCAGWIEIEKEVDIPAGGGRREVPFSISVPAGAEGAYYGFIHVSLIPDKPETEQTVMLIRPTLSVRVELEIAGMKKVALSIADISFEHELGDGRPGFLLSVRNEGNIKTTFEGDVLLYAGTRRFPFRAIIPPDADGKPLVVFPELVRQVRCPLTDLPSPGSYTAEVRVRMAGEWRTRSSFDIEVPPRGSLMSGPVVSRGRSECDINVGAEPEYFEVMLPTGASRLNTIRIRNRDSVAVKARVSVKDVVQEENGFLTYSDVADTSRRWVEVTPVEFTLEPASTRTLRLNITTPEFHDMASRMCAVRIMGTAGTDEDGWLSEVDLGIPIIAVPAGASECELEISKFDVVRQGAEHNPTAAILRVSNAGGRTAKLKGKIVLERAASRMAIQTMHISEMDGLILAPGATREFRMPLPYLDKDQFRLKAELSAAGESKAVTTAEVTFVCTQGPN